MRAAVEAASLSRELWGSARWPRRKKGALSKGFLRNAPPSQPASPASLLLEVFGVAPSPVNDSVICAVLALERWDQVPLDGPTAGGSACRGTHPVVPLEARCLLAVPIHAPNVRIRARGAMRAQARRSPESQCSRAMREIGRYGRQRRGLLIRGPEVEILPGAWKEAHAHFSVPGTAGHGDMGEEMAAPAARVATRS